MGQWYRKRTDDVVDVPKELDASYKGDPEWEPYKAPAPAPTEAKASAKGKTS